MHRILDNIIFDKVLLVIVDLQAYKQAYEEFKALAIHNFEAIQPHFKQAELSQKEFQDTSVEHGLGMSAEDAALNGMTKNMLYSANAVHCNEMANAGMALVETNASMQQTKDGLTAPQQ